MVVYEYIKTPVLISSIFFVFIIFSNAQIAVIPGKNNFVFSAIKGTVSKPVSLVLPPATRSVKFSGGDVPGFKILSNKNKKFTLAFVPRANFIGIARSKLLVLNASGKAITEINLTGLSTNGLEGENEAPLSSIVEALGYKTNPGWKSLANHSRPELEGDELPPSLFHKAGKGNVQINPVARYSPDFELPFGYYYVDSATRPEEHQVGVLAKAGKYPEHQTLFPAIASGSNSFDPGKKAFGFYAAGPSHTAYSEDVWNRLLHPGNAVRAARIYPLKDATGKLLINTYLLCFEEAKNGDYNDYVFLVKNIAPLTKAPLL